MHTICVTRANSLPTALHLHSLLNSSQNLKVLDSSTGRARGHHPGIHIPKQTRWSSQEDSRNDTGCEVVTRGQNPGCSNLSQVTSLPQVSHEGSPWQRLINYGKGMLIGRQGRPTTQVANVLLKCGRKRCVGFCTLAKCRRCQDQACASGYKLNYPLNSIVRETESSGDSNGQDYTHRCLSVR